jgi:hypothetical protein
MLKTVDFYYGGVECDYSRIYDCENYGCESEGICRCGTIEDAVVNNIDFQRVNSEICKRYSAESITEVYCVERLIRIHELYSPEKWDVKIESGYYGQEIDGIFIIESVANALEKDIDSLLKLRDGAQKFKYVLIQEYGYLLNGLQDKEDCHIIEIDKKDIILQTEHYNKLDKNAVKSYEKHCLPLGIVVKKGDKFRLIDGYHRINSSKNDKVEVIVME